MLPLAPCHNVRQPNGRSFKQTELAAGTTKPAIRVNGAELAVPHTGCFALVEHERHTAAVLELEVGDGVTCHAVQFTAGLP